MVYMQNEMIESLKKDIREGKIWGLKLVKHPCEVIRNNTHGDIFNIVREIVDADDQCFYLRTNCRHADGKAYLYDCEAYYEAFSYYDGDILRSILNIPAAVDEKDAIQITEYEVLRSY